MYPSSFCTICTKQCKQELIGLLLSLSVHHPNKTIYVMCDKETKLEIDNLSPNPKLNIKWFIELDKYSKYNRSQMVTMNIWHTFLKNKAEIMIKALNFEKDVIFIDSDTIILNKLEIDNSYDIGLSPQFVKSEIVDKTGYYNAGLLWTNKKSVCEYWKKITIENHDCPEQIHMKKFCNKFKYFEFGENYNLQTWRFIVGKEPGNKIASYLNIKNNKIYYKDKPLKFIHTHFNDDRFKGINKFFISNMMQAKLYRELLIIFRLINRCWKIKLPKQPMNGIWHHNNDSFRELAILLKKYSKDVDIELINNSGNCWLEPNIILYDRPTLEWCNNEIKNCSLFLLGNGDINKEGKELKKICKYVRPWIFWARKPFVIEKILNENGILSWNERTNESIFIGNFENNVQKKYRKTNINWEEVLSEYHCTAGQKHKFTNKEYLMKLRNSKFGLCLRGYGSKCHREVELMAFGTIPIITEHVSIESYLDPPKENVHFIKCKNINEWREKVNKIKKKDWELMSQNCYEWYQRNIYSKNCWESMLNNILYN